MIQIPTAAKLNAKCVFMAYNQHQSMK